MYNYPFYDAFSYYPTGSMASGLLKGGGASSFLKGAIGKFSWNSFLTSTGKTLNVINQAIPIFYQVRPIVQNAKTMFKVLGAVKETSKGESFSSSQSMNQGSSYSDSKQTPSLKEVVPTFDDEAIYTEDGSPTFFL